MEIGVEKVGLLGLELKKYKMNLQYLVTPEDNEVLKEKKKKDRDSQKGTP